MAAVQFTCRHFNVINPSGQHGHVTPRPWVEVKVSSQGLAHRAWCLVDTGADDTILDLGAAAMLSIIPTALPQVPVATATSAGGSAPMFGVHRCLQLDFCGTSVSNVDVLFGAVRVPLLGRSALLAAAGGVEAGFASSLWQHT
jgi:hypothetical protein